MSWYRIGWTSAGSVAHLVDERATREHQYNDDPIAICAVFLQGRILEPLDQPLDSPILLCRHCSRRFHLRMGTPEQPEEFTTREIAMPLDFESMTWTCHVCKDNRPDRFISVFKRELVRNEVPLTENIRHCNDRPACIAGATTYSHFDKGG